MDISDDDLIGGVNICGIDNRDIVAVSSSY